MTATLLLSPLGSISAIKFVITSYSIHYTKLYDLVGLGLAGDLSLEEAATLANIAAGQSSVLIHEVLPAGEIIERIAVEADEILGRLGASGR